MKIPDRGEITKYLAEAKINNQGPWDKHSLNVGKAAMIIASNCDDLDENVAYAMGALHDIGRREGVFHMHHIIEGFNYMTSENYEHIARICLTHSFPSKNIAEYNGKADCSSEELIFIKEYLGSIEYDDYDRLIQLCDALALPNGFCLMEKRLVNVVLRHGANDFLQAKWKAYFKNKEYFETKMGVSIYDILPNVKENTFKS